MTDLAWTHAISFWVGALAGIVIVALIRTTVEHATQPDPETQAPWQPRVADLEMDGGTSTPTVPSRPAELRGPER